MAASSATGAAATRAMGPARKRPRMTDNQGQQTQTRPDGPRRNEDGWPQARGWQTGTCSGRSRCCWSSCATARATCRPSAASTRRPPSSAWPSSATPSSLPCRASLPSGPSGKATADTSRTRPRRSWCRCWSTPRSPTPPSASPEVRCWESAPTSPGSGRPWAQYWFVPALIPCLMVTPLLYVLFSNLNKRQTRLVLSVTIALSLLGFAGQLVEMTFPSATTEGLLGIANHLFPASTLLGSYLPYFCLGYLAERVPDLYGERGARAICVLGWVAWPCVALLVLLGFEPHNPDYSWVVTTIAVFCLFAKICVRGRRTSAAITWWHATPTVSTCCRRASSTLSLPRRRARACSIPAGRARLRHGVGRVHAGLLPRLACGGGAPRRDRGEARAGGVRENRGRARPPRVAKALRADAPASAGGLAS